MTQTHPPLVSPTQLHDELATPAVAPTVLDVRWVLGGPSQRPAYDEGHIPGAHWIELEEVASGPVDPRGTGGRHPMPDRDAVERAMRAAGVEDERAVVVYDAGNSLAAARMWFVLRAFGHPHVRVLDGGYAAWLDAGYDVSTDPAEPGEGDFLAEEEPAGVIEADEVEEYAARHLLLDGRPRERFHGQNETIDPVAGHIPGAVSMPALANVDDSGRFLPADDLAMRFTAAGVAPGGKVGVYCGSGVQAAHLALAMEAAGLHPETAVYVGSWSDWITDPDRPVATD